MFEQAFRNIAGCTTELDYTEQSSWLLFLKYYDGPDKATLVRKKYSYILDNSDRWEIWGAAKGKGGHHFSGRSLRWFHTQP